MGQYYYAVILDAQGKIVVWMNAFPYGSGVKLMEHSYIDNAFVNTFEFSLSPEGALYKSRVVWAGDYADNEPGQEKNLHDLCNDDEKKLITPAEKNASKYRYLVNHTKKQYVDKTKTGNLHPLPLMTAEGNGRGGGDIYDAPSFVGSWARDVISVEEAVPGVENFQEIVFELGEERA
jgi:hypothetical protein